MTEFAIGDIIEGKVTGLQPYGVFVQLNEREQGLVHISECKHGFVTDLNEFIAIGQKVKVIIIDIDEFTHKISLSMRALQPLNIPNYPARIKKKPRRRLPNIGFKTLAKKMPEWIKEGEEIIAKDEFNLYNENKLKK
ncbi:general stress protein [Suicoccus acidiformans]|uniref:General stress protein n=1 Tax=Suicoccus acidiformans TaxID=2036206 RepID=A0A347WJK0_9LACT|nr:CvfD/Ygs/GSP13 family RNA-binding post-transcriptional regulator [Suicoccus acidiformans]AXY25257.1 general stress protein [Suicoccus acidiformans]